jgi:general secretion pathway protein G
MTNPFVIRATRRSLNRERGLTLIEIIVALIIFSVIMAFLLGKVFAMGGQAKAEATRLKLTDLKSNIYLFQMRSNALPQSLDQAGVTKEQTSDAWGNPVAYRIVDGRSYELKSLGADGKDGGQGADADIIVTGP